MTKPRIETLMPVIDGLGEHGARPALIVLAGEGAAIWSYGELAERVARLAAGLAARVEAGGTVAIFAGDCPQWIVCALAAIRAGAVVLPIDAQLAPDTLAHVLADSAARLIFTTGERLPRLDALGAGDRAVLLDAPADDPRSWLKLCADAPAPPTGLMADAPAALFYTSGTTGRPKGVPLSHANLAFQVETLLACGLVAPDDRVALPLPLHHVYPFVLGVLVPLALGLPLILPRSLTGPEVVRALREGEATVMIGVPRLYAAMLDGIQARVRARGRLATAVFGGLLALSEWLRSRFGLHIGRYLFGRLHRQIAPRLRLLACGGAALDPALALRLEALGWRLAIGYGLTETAPLLTLNLPPSSRLESAGRPVPGVELRIAAGPDGSGEIQARGPNVFAGYRHLPDKTAEAFTADGWFRTGDLGRLDDGYLTITGRAKELIVTAGGENIQPEEVERAYAAHPFVREFALLENQGRLAGLVLPEPGAIRQAGWQDIDAAVRAALAEAERALPSYQRVVEFAVTRDPLPRTRLGKLRRHLLAGAYQQARAGSAPDAGGTLPVEAMAEADRLLLEDPAAHAGWDVLAERFSGRRLTPDTSLRLDLAVDSLGWLDLAVAIQQRCGVELSEAALARIETVRDLLMAVREAPRTDATPLSWADPEHVLAVAQRRLIAPHGGLANLALRTLHAINRGLMRLLFRVRAQGLERLPAGPLVLAPNHASYLDPFALAAVSPWPLLRRTYSGGWTGAAFANPLSRALSRLTLVLPIAPEGGARSSLALAAAVLARGDNLMWFPEGERAADGRLQALRPGLGLLLQRYPAPLVPVYIEGAYEALPRRRRWPRLTRISVRFGEPLDPRTCRDDAEITQALRARLAAMQAEADSLIAAGQRDR